MARSTAPAPGDKPWLRSLYWGASVIGPVLTALGFMDIAAHSGSPETSPMIGLEGGGAPNAIPFLFVGMAFACISGALFARSMLPDPKPSLPGAVLLSMVTFVAAAIGARPLFQAKWRHDCDRGVGRACWAVAQLTLDASKKEGLLARACEHGDARGCPKPEEPAPAPSASASKP